MKSPAYPLDSNRCSPIGLFTILGWLAFMSTSSANPPSESPEEIIERLTGFTKVEITRVSPHKIHIRHHEGGKTLRYDELPDSLRKRFGMTSETAKLAEKQEAITRLENARLRIKNQFLTQGSTLITGVVIQVLETGVLVADGIAHTDREESILVEKQICIDGPTTLNPNRPHRYRRVLTDENATIQLLLPGLVYVETPTGNFFDGATFEATIWHDGNHNVLVDEQIVTVPAFTTCGEKAWHRHLKNSR